MQVLFIHQNFPGQYRHLAAALHARGEQVVAIGGPTAQAMDGVSLHRYDARPSGGMPACHSWVADLQAKVLRGEAVGRLLQTLLQQGLRPDLVIGHPAWGEMLSLRDQLPELPVLHQVEFVYKMSGGDVGFDPGFPIADWQDLSRLRLRRTFQMQPFLDFSWGLAPTAWQASTVPAEYRDRVSVIHEGIDTTRIAPRPGSEIRLQKRGLRFQPGDEVISFVARSLEPYRGFHSFMRMLPILQALRPNAHVLIVGSEGVSYGPPPATGGSWRQVLMQELEGRLALERIHFVGRVPHPVLHDLFRVCACHVYLTYPFVLSWSLLEAMACGAVVIGSDTPPLHDVITPGVNGLLVDFFDAEALAQQIAAVLADPAGHRHLGDAARAATVARFDLRSVCLPAQLELVDQLAAGLTPPAPPHSAP